MKLIIDIPEEHYKHICERAERFGKGSPILSPIEKEVVNGIPLEEKTGHWIEHPKDIYAHLVCNKCLSNAPYDCQTNYCPNCGAKMKGDN